MKKHSKGYYNLGNTWRHVPRHSLSEDKFNLNRQLRIQLECTEWRNLPGISNCRDLIKSEIAEILSSSLHYPQVQKASDIAAIFEHWLFMGAASWMEYLEKETLLQRLQAVVKNMDGTLQSQLLDRPIAIYEYVFSQRRVSHHPSALRDIVYLPKDCPSFTTFTDMDALSNYYSVPGGTSNQKTSSKSTNPYSQQQHADSDDMNLTDFWQSIAFATSMGNSPQTEFLNLLIHRNVLGEISEVPNLFPSMSSSSQISSLEELRQHKPQKMNFQQKFEHFKEPTVIENYGSSDNSEVMSPPKKRKKMEHVFGLKNGTLPAPKMVQPCNPEGTTDLHQQQQSPLSIIDDVKGGTEFNQAGENATNEVIEPKTELEKETKSSSPTLNGVSLTGFLKFDQIREHVMSFRQQFGQSITEDKEEREISTSSCQLCGIDKHFFAPLPIYCSSCNVRIKKNAYYYCKGAEEFDTKYCFCTTCHKNSQYCYIAFNDTSVSKTLLERKRNDVIEEPWVQCDKCNGWQHQICALYNNKRDLEGNAEYLCPKCCLKEIENGVCVPSPMSETSIFGAKDLPRTMLSEYIEQRLFKHLAQERVDKAKIEGKNLDEVLSAENLCVRVLSSVNKQLKVQKQFLDIFPTKNYPSEYNYGSKVICLFQKIEGVDVCLFVMYVQEFGSECGYPNQRCVYISYLDSVNYLRPRRETVTGEALRTFVYHEILIGYLDFCKKRGFATCYIWACPPLKGDDYILYCHPETQKTPKSDKLRHWYHSMLSKASEENIVVGVTNMYDHFFDATGKCDSKVAAARLPYFDGDYWSGAAMSLFRKIGEEEDVIRKVKKRVTKRTLKAMDHTNSSEGTSKDALVVQKLGQKILPFKEDFMVVHLQQTCMQCHEVIMSGKRWFCSQCKKFQECERCHTADTHISISGEKHELRQALVDDIPFDTKGNDIILDNELIETRDKFLIFCQKNNFQFDTLRRAKHSSMMILYHLKNLAMLTARKICSICCKENEIQKSWQCEICPFTVCSACFKESGACCHEHQLNQCSSTELC